MCMLEQKAFQPISRLAMSWRTSCAQVLRDGFWKISLANKKIVPFCFLYGLYYLVLKYCWDIIFLVFLNITSSSMLCDVLIILSILGLRQKSFSLLCSCPTDVSTPICTRNIFLDFRTLNLGRKWCVAQSVTKSKMHIKCGFTLSKADFLCS